MDTELTYGQFHQRRSRLISKLLAAQRVYKRTIDPNYTPLVNNGQSIVMGEIVSLQTELADLLKEWQKVLTKRGVK